MAKEKIIKTLTNNKGVNTRIENKWMVSRHSYIDKIVTLTTPIWDSKAKRLKPRMTIANACHEVGITPQTYNSWLREDPLLAQMVEDVYASHRQMMDDMANWIIMEWLNGDVKLRPNEKIQLAKWFVEKTNPYFNPTQKVEVDANNNNFNMSEEEIINRLRELSQETWTEILIPNQIKQEDVNFTSPDSIKESTSDQEANSRESESWMSTSGDWSEWVA